MSVEPKKQARVQWMGATVWVFDAETDQDLFSMAADTPNLAYRLKAKATKLGYEVEQVRSGRNVGLPSSQRQSQMACRFCIHAKLQR